MNTNSVVVPAQLYARAELNGESETVTFSHEPPPPYSPVNSIVTNQPIIHQTFFIQPPLKGGPMFFNCPRCNERVLTTVHYVNTRKTHMLAGFVCGFTLWCMLCCLAAIPYMVPTFKKVEHYCPTCNAFLGAYSKI